MKRMATRKFANTRPQTFQYSFGYIQIFPRCTKQKRELDFNFAQFGLISAVWQFDFIQGNRRKRKEEKENRIYKVY